MVEAEDLEQEADQIPASAERISSLARAEFDKILSCRSLEMSERNRRFLRYVVEETLAGRADRITGYSIALAVFDRDSTLDPQIDPVVRIDAGHLRRALERYYFTDGLTDPSRINILKGGYIPTFEIAAQSPARAHSVEAVPQLMIIPFSDLSPDKITSNFALGLTDDVIVATSMLGNVRIFAATAGENASNASAWGASDHDRFQVIGTVRLTTGRVRVIVHLIEQTDFSYLASKIFERRLERAAPFELQHQPGQEIGTWITRLINRTDIDQRLPKNHRATTNEVPQRRKPLKHQKKEGCEQVLHPSKRKSANLD
jgi:TolB-like protein